MEAAKKIVVIALAVLLFAQGSLAGGSVLERSQAPTTNLSRGPLNAAEAYSSAPPLDEVVRLSSWDIAIIVEQFTYDPQTIKLRTDSLRSEFQRTEDAFNAKAKAIEKQIGGDSFGTNAVVTKAVENQLRAKTSNYMFHVRKETPKWTETRVYVNTTEGIANLLVAVNERPVDDEQLAREAVCLQKLLRDPEALHKKQASENEASRRETEIVRALPHAFMYEYEGTESGKGGQDIVRLRFRPDPQFHPTSREGQVLTGFEGTMFIDVQREMIVRIEGTLFRGVNFGWGLGGHLDKGGRFLAEQTDVGDGNWRITRLSLDLTGHALLFKHIGVQFTETASQFEQVTGTLTFADGVKLLKDQVNAGSQGKPRRNCWDEGKPCKPS